MTTMEMVKKTNEYADMRKRMNVIMREFELSQKEKIIPLTNVEQEELGAMRIANALKDGFYC